MRCHGEWIDLACRLTSEFALPALSAGYASLVAQAKADASLRGFAELGECPPEVAASWKKKNGELATQGEREAEARMRAEVARRYPRHAIQGEELGFHAGSGCLWVFDPIDGTSAMVRAAIAEAFGLRLPTPVPAFGVTVAIVRDGEAVLGVIAELAPRNGGLAMKSRWVGASGFPTTLNGSALPVPAAPVALADAVLCCTVPEIMFATPAAWSGYQALEDATAGLTRDQNCLGFMRILEGSAHVAYEADLAYHDTAAQVPIMVGAGVCVTDAQGRALDFSLSRMEEEFTLLAAAPALHAQALERIRRGIPGARSRFKRPSGAVNGYLRKFAAQ